MNLKELYLHKKFGGGSGGSGGGYTFDDMATGDVWDVVLNVDYLRTSVFSNTRIKSVYSETLVGTAGSNSTATFNGCRQLKTVHLPNFKGFDLSSGGPASMFQNCTSLEELVLPELASYGTGWFAYNCTALKRLVTPKADIGSTGQYTVTGCTALEFWDVGFCTRVSDYACWNNTPALTTLILRYDGVVPTHAVSAKNNLLTVYVKQAWIEEYKVATNWAAAYEAGTVTFAALEGSEYE